MIRCVFHLGCVLLAALTARADVPPAKKSPFLPPAGQAAAPVAENTPIEFRGLLVISGNQKFNFFEPIKRVSTWVGLNESGSPVMVKSFNATAETVAVEFGGRTMTLALQKAKKIDATPVSMGVSVATASTTPIEQPAIILNPTAADEAKRLDSIAAEVRRRRLLRSQVSPTTTAPKDN